MRVLAAGDHFVAPEEFERALRAEQGVPVDLDVVHLTGGWPTEPFGEVGSGDSVVHEASGTEDTVIGALEGARVCLTQMAPFTEPVFAAATDLELVAVNLSLELLDQALPAPIR